MKTITIYPPVKIPDSEYCEDELKDYKCASLYKNGPGIQSICKQFGKIIDRKKPIKCQQCKDLYQEAKSKQNLITNEGEDILLKHTLASRSDETDCNDFSNSIIKHD